MRRSRNAVNRWCFAIRLFSSRWACVPPRAGVLPTAGLPQVGCTCGATPPCRPRSPCSGSTIFAPGTSAARRSCGISGMFSTTITTASATHVCSRRDSTGSCPLSKPGVGKAERRISARFWKPVNEARGPCCAWRLDLRRRRVRAWPWPRTWTSGARWP